MKRQIADLHIHSRFSRACSRDLNLYNLDATCRKKGVDIIGTGDFTFPTWFEEMYDELEENNIDYLMIHASNLINYEPLIKLLPPDKTLVFWYLTTDEMYVVQPKRNSWLYKLKLKAREMPLMKLSPKEPCLWWC